MLSLIRKFRPRLIGSRSDISTRGKNLKELKNTQQSFVLWNAERLGISIQESRERYFASWSAIDGGHSGPDYRLFADLSYKLFQVYFNDIGDEIYKAYEYHSYQHLLRMLSYAGKIS